MKNRENFGKRRAVSQFFWRRFSSRYRNHPFGSMVRNHLKPIQPIKTPADFCSHYFAIPKERLIIDFKGIAMTWVMTTILHYPVYNLWGLELDLNSFSYLISLFAVQPYLIPLFNSDLCNFYWFISNYNYNLCHLTMYTIYL